MTLTASSRAAPSRRCNVLGAILSAIQTLLLRWTQTLADRLDATVSSRAPASTALSTATWTSTKAGYLDTPVSSCAPASSALSSGVWTLARAAKLDNLDVVLSTCTRIKSIQRGSISISGVATSVTATIGAVVTAKTELRFLGATSKTGGGSVEAVDMRIELTNSTTITATRQLPSGGSGYAMVGGWELTEFY